MSLFATGIADARMRRVTAAGAVLVSWARDGRVILLEADRNDDGAADGQRVLLEGLTRPNGLDLAGGYRYVGEEDGIGRIAFDPRSGIVDGGYHRLVDGLPSGGNHWKKTIRFGPHGLLYVAVGSSCNACIEDDARRAAILLYTLEGEFVPDPDLSTGSPALDASVAPAHGFSAHNAPLGVVFLRHDHHPPEYLDAAIVALHGSWNRTRKDGHKVVSLHFATDGSVEERHFLTGFLVGDAAIGRPAEVAEGPDGSVYVSDDFGSAVYRVGHGAQRGVSSAARADDRGGSYDPTAISAPDRAAALATGPAVLGGEGCLVCHAESPGADQAQALLTDLAARFSIDGLVEYLAMPRPPMPPYDAPVDQCLALAIYLLESY